MLRRRFTSANGSRVGVCGYLGAPARPAQLASRRLFANAGATPPPPSGGGVKAFGLLVGAAAVASAWTGYRYVTEPPFRSRLNDFWSSLSVPSFSSPPTTPPSGGASPSSSSSASNTAPSESEEETSGTQPTPAATAAETSFALPETTLEPVTHAREETVVALPDMAAPTDAEAEQKPTSEGAGGEEVRTVPPASPTFADGNDSNSYTTTPSPAQGDVEEAGGAEEPQPNVAAVPAAVVALITESFAASDAHQEAVAANAAAAVAAAHEGEDETTSATGADAKLHQPEEQQQQQQQQQHEEETEAKQPGTDHATRLQELQAIKEIIAIQAESCDRQVKKKVERLRQKYEQRMAALRQQMEELVTERVDIERHKLTEELRDGFHRDAESLRQQFLTERQRLYAEMEDLVAGLNARFVELVHEEERLLQEQLDASARLHSQTLAYLQTLVEDAEYRSRHLGEEREWWSWTEKLAGAVGALERAALGPAGHLHPFQAELDLVRSLAATRPVYRAVARHIEAHASVGIYSVGRLKERFEQVEKHVRVAALVPEGGGLLSHAVAPLLAASVSINPFHKPTSQELLLDSARRHLLQEDDLLAALHHMEQLTGLAHELANDWIEEARKRLTVEQAISVIAADLATHKPSTTDYF